MIAEKLYEARRTAKAIPSFSSVGVALDLVQAYEVQNTLLERDLSSGRALCGYKLGLTSRAKQIDVGVDQPILGYLCADSELTYPFQLPTASLIHPRVEPEIAFVLKQGLVGKVSAREALKAVEMAVLALEVIDSRYENFQFQLADVVADNTSASHFVMGSKNLLNDWDRIETLGVLLTKNGELVQTGTPAATLGNPLNALVALVELLSGQGKELKAGAVVLTGGLTASIPVLKGDWIEVRSQHDKLTLEIA